MPFPFIFTFYSFKGGVGRSLAAMNVAYTLAGRGRHVLVVDMDLEAPGISGFLQRNEELALATAANPKDVLTLLDEVQRAALSGVGPEEAAASLPPLSSYIRSVKAEKLQSLRPQLGLLGRLDVLGTDLDREYLARLAGLELGTRSPDELVACSRILWAYFKSQRFPFRPLGLEPFEPPIDTPYDYVLVDSRTGITEIGGLCIGPLADRLVVLTALNDQNVHGTQTFLNEAGIRPREKDEAPWDEADKPNGAGEESASLGPKPTILVASPVPAGEISYKRERLSRLESELGLRPVVLSYHPQMALMESVFVRDYPEETLSGEYRGLADRVMAQAADRPNWPARAIAELGRDDAPGGPGIEGGLWLAALEPAIGRTLFAKVFRAPLRDDEGSRMRRQVYATLARIPEMRAAALNNWGAVLEDQARMVSREEADQWHAAAVDKYAETLRIKPDFHEALSNWGNTLSEQAKSKTDEDAIRLYTEAGEMCARALRIRPDFHPALSNWGNALSGLAGLVPHDEADELYSVAREKYSEALRLKPDFHEAASNWAASLIHQSRLKTGQEAMEFLDRARAKLLEAEKIRPGSGSYNLACVEAMLGRFAASIDWLRKARDKGGRVTRGKISADSDFDTIRDQPEFRSFLESLPE